jgi:hypothetical protein
MPLASGLCSLDGWELDRTCMSIPAGTTEETIEMWRLAAAELLFGLSGNRFGPSCPVTVRPCARRCVDGLDWFGRYLNQGQFLGRGFQFTGPFVPFMAGGSMFNASLCGCSDTCHCGPEMCQVYLPGPIFDVVSVDVDGVVVDPLTYSVLDGRFLVRSSATPDDAAGGTCWPSCQDMSLRPGQPNTFTIVYRTGIPLSALGRQALSKLTEHYIQGCNGCGCGAGSRQNVTRLSRQGVDMEFEPVAERLADGRTGIEIVDQWLHMVNPSKLPQAMRVLSPDAPRRPRVWYSGS